MYLAFTEGIPSPPLFRLWSAITTVAAALERRVWASTSGGQIHFYPNMYTLLVGPPGTGKDQAIRPAQDLLATAKLPGTSKRMFQLSPDDMTSASLLDAMMDATRKIVLPNEVIEYHSLAIFAPEFGVFVQQYDLAFLSKLNALWDNPRVFSERRRHSNAGKPREIIAPQLNILAGSQPTFLASMLPDEAWGMGFTSRLLCIYAPSAPITDYFTTRPSQDAIKASLLRGLIELGSLRGEVTFEDDAKKLLRGWHGTGMKPIPQHSKLQHYNARRMLHLLKLCIVASASASYGAPLTISREHAQRALDWLLGAEQVMPDLFRDMVLRSDSQVLQELHFYCVREHIRTKKPVHEALLIQFLSTKVPSEKVLRLLEVAERADVLIRVEGTKTYLPKQRPDNIEE